MPDLASCYFCGTVAGSITERPIADAAGAPSEFDRTIVLCQDCREKLDRILTPVFAHQPSQATDDQETDSVTDDDASGSETDAEPTESMAWPEATSRGRETTSDSTDSASSMPTAQPDHPETDDGEDEAGPTDAAVDNGEDHESTNDDPDGNTGKPSDTELPDGTRQVLRLLRNREFPIDRVDIEEVARSAYDFDRGECGRVIDALIDHDILRESDGQLYPND